MRPTVIVTVNEETEQTTIGLKHGVRPDPWRDCATLMEGIGVLARSCAVEGKTTHNGKSISAYLHDYLDSVLGDYSRTLHVVVPAVEGDQK